MLLEQPDTRERRESGCDGGAYVPLRAIEPLEILMDEPSASTDKTDPSTESRLRHCCAVANEQEWLASSNTDAMGRLLDAWLTGGIPRATLFLAAGPALDRRFRLYAGACVRRVWHLLDDERLRRAVEAAEA